jgi:Tfp pilus assembly protein PilF
MRSNTVLLTAVIAGSFWLTGCKTLSLPWNKQPQPSAVVVDRPEATAAKELPPKKAAQVCLAAAKELDGQGHDAQAIALYERAREHDPALKQIARRLAVLYDRQGNSTKAREEYARALEESPRDANLLNDIGYFFYQRGQWDDAEKWLRQAVDVDPKHQRAWTNLGLAYGQQGRYQQSYESFCKVVSPAAAHSNVGALLAQNGHHNLADQALRQALALEPDLQQSRVILAHLETNAASPAQTTPFTVGNATILDAKHFNRPYCR